MQEKNNFQKNNDKNSHHMRNDHGVNESIGNNDMRELKQGEEGHGQQSQLLKQGNKRVAVVLSGCGYLDGSEINEAVFTFLALDEYGLGYEVFAPDLPQHSVVNHINYEKQPKVYVRNMMEESARITRGKVRNLKDLCVNELDAIVVVGGFGVVKNLSNLALDSSKKFIVIEDLVRSISGFYLAKKPIAAICIAPTVVAKVLKDCGARDLSVTIGQEKGEVLEELGVNHVFCNAEDIVVDKKNLVISTPAFMDEAASLTQIASGIRKLVAAIFEREGSA